jgi:hypothetical protein
MAIREDILLKGSDGDMYKYSKGARTFINQRTHRFANREERYDLFSEVISRKLVIGDNIFQELIELSRLSGYKDPEWGRIAIKDMQKMASGVYRSRERTRGELLAESEFKKGSGVQIGRPCMFYYDAKYKSKLPYWDRFPVVIPIERGAGYFIGMNVHYLKIESRAILLDMLYSTMLVGHKNRDRLYEKVRLGQLPASVIHERTMDTYLDISYSKILSKIKGVKYFKPTIHKYLTSHIKSRVIEITPRGWTMCMFLPTAKFEKMSEREVQNKSEEKAMK